MARPFGAGERRRVAAGVVAGIIATVIGLAFWIIWGGDPLTTEDVLRYEVDAEAEPVAPAAPYEDGVDAVTGPVVGARERRILERVAAVSPAPRRRLAVLDFRVGDVTWRDPAGETWARARAFTGRLDLGAAERGDIVVTGATIAQPVVTLRQDARGDWNWQAVFAQLLDGEPAVGPTRLFTVRSARVTGGHVTAHTPERTVVFEQVDMQIAALTFSDHQRRDPHLLLTTATTTFVVPADDVRLPVRLAGGDIRFPAGRVLFDIDAATVAGTRLAELTGEFSDRIPGMGLRIAGRALELDLADFAFALPEGMPAAGTATFAFEFEPLTDTGSALRLADLDFAADGTRVLGSVSMIMDPDGFELRQADLRLDPLALALVEQFTGPLPYGGVLRGTVTGTDGDIRFDLIASLTAPGVPTPFTVGLTGRALMVPAGVALQRLEADLRAVPLLALQPIAPGIPLRGTATGVVVLTGPPAVAPLQLDMRLQVAAGVFTVTGMVDLTGAVARYDVTGRILGVNLQALLEPDVPPVTLTASFALAGSGFDPALADARIALEGRFTGWETTPADTVSLAARVQQGTLHVDALSLQLATLTLGADGVWRFVEPMAGAVAYRLAVSDLRPFGPYVPVLGDTIARGMLRAEGTVGGTFDRLQLEGGIAASALQFGDWAASMLEARYTAVLGDEMPHVVLDAVAQDLVTPTAGSFPAATVELRLEPPLFTLAVHGERADDTGVHLVAEGHVPLVGEREVLLQRLDFDIDEQRWTLAQPARIAWVEDDGLRVSGFELHDRAGPGRVRLDGRVLPLAEMDVVIATEAMPVGPLQELLGREPVVTGELWSTALVRGPGEAPTIDARFRLDGGELQGVPITYFEGALAYAPGLLEARASLVLAEAGNVTIDGTVPMTIVLGETMEFTLRDDAPIAIVGVAERLALGPIADVSPFVEDAEGFIDGNFEISGTPAAPVLAGRFTLVDGAVTVPELNQRFVDGVGDIELRDRQIVIHQIRARADGWATLSGAITLADLTTPVFDLTMQLDGFRAVTPRDRRGPAIYGQTRVVGAIDEPVLTGRLRFEDGTIEIPDMPPTLDFIDTALPPLPFEDELLLPVPPVPVWHAAVQVRGLALVAGDNLWIDGFGARVQLTGEVIVDRVGEDLIVTGTLEGTRGQYILAAGPLVRRFDISHAQIRFLGTGELNPAIDITARRRVIDPAGRNLEIDVRVGGTAQAPTLTLASQDAAMIPQSELLSFLIFGQPSFALGGGVLPAEGLLEQTFVGGIAELASIELEQAIVRDLGLPVDVFQVHLGTGRWGGFGVPMIFLGRELAPDVYLTVETGLGALFAETEGGTNTWAIRLEWAIDHRMTLRGGYEPVHRARLLRGIRFALPTTAPQQQMSLELRRRWYY